MAPLSRVRTTDQLQETKFKYIAHISLLHDRVYLTIRTTTVAASSPRPHNTVIFLVWKNRDLSYYTPTRQSRWVALPSSKIYNPTQQPSQGSTPTSTKWFCKRVQMYICPNERPWIIQGHDLSARRVTGIAVVIADTSLKVWQAAPLKLPWLTIF